MTSQPSRLDDDSIDFAEMYHRVRRGLSSTIGLSLVGLALGLTFTAVITGNRIAASTLRVTFGFPGFERGQYPNGTKFQPDDIRAPDVVNEAIKRVARDLKDPAVASEIRGGIGISGFISPNVTKERDKLRAAGQTLPPYFPDEYEISLSLPRHYALDIRQRELVLAEIVNAYSEKFRRTYVDLPQEFANPFASLQSADFVEYELILTKEMQSLHAFLEQKLDGSLETDKRANSARESSQIAKQFRSPTNGLSFQDLLKQTELFTQIRLNDVLGRIYIFGLSKDRNYALVKMDYYLRTLEDQEHRLIEEENVVTGLLQKTQERAQNYVLAAKTQTAQSAQPIIDQGFIDSLLTNDAYNFLVRRALDAGLAVRRVQADKARLQERRQRMESFAKGEVRDQALAIADTQKALSDLQKAYEELLTKVRTVLDDYSRQEYADAIRISMQARTEPLWRSLLLGAGVGLCIGAALGVGYSLLNLGSRRP